MKEEIKYGFNIFDKDRKARTRRINQRAKDVRRRREIRYRERFHQRGSSNYFLCSFQWGDLDHEPAMRSIELFSDEIMPRHAKNPKEGSVAG